MFTIAFRTDRIEAINNTIRKDEEDDMGVSNWDYINYTTDWSRGSKREKQKKGIGKRIWLILFLAAALLNLIAWYSTPFCDWYVENIFPLWGKTYGRLCGLVSYSVGEIMLCLAVLLIVLAVFFLLIRIIGNLLLDGEWYKKLFRYYIKFLAWIFLAVVWVMTLNCTILYHTSAFDQKYMEDTVNKEYSVEDLTKLRNYVVGQLNTLAQELERDSSGYIVYKGDIAEEAVKEMERLGKTYDQLAGYYSLSKPIYFSGFLSQQHMAGYYFPFSMETNYNNIMYISNKPHTICHELAHFKGFIYEGDAGFIGYLACITSENPFFQYSGYLGVYNYIENDFKRSITEKKYQKQEQISDLVKGDNIFLTKEAWEQVEEKAIINTETVDNLSDIFTNVSLKLNGVESGMACYYDVVELLLQYYDGNL